MTLKIPSQGEVELLRNMLSGAPAQPLLLKLYVNDKTPGDEDNASSFVEMSTHGYAHKELGVAEWTFAPLSLVAEATHVAQSWTFLDGPATPVYGYYVVGKNDGIVRWAERFSPVFSAEIAGDKLTVTPKITFSSF